MSYRVEAILSAVDSGFTSKFNQATKSVEKLQNQANKVSGVASKIGSATESIGKSLTTKLTLPLLAVGGLGLKTAAQFEKGMSSVRAITNATGTDFTKLKNKALQLGESTSFSASEVTEAMTELAKSGWTTNDVLTGTSGVLDAAAASGENLNTVATIVADTISGFNMKASESGRVADVLTQAANSGTIGINDLGESFKYVGPLSRTMGFNIEEVASALTAMSQSGIKGSQAGTSLRTALTNMVKPTKTMKAAMNELGIEITNQDGSFKSLDEILSIMRNSFSGLTDDQKAYYASIIAGKEGQAGLLSLLNMSQKEYDKISKSMKNAGGVAKETAQIMRDNLMDKFEELGGALETLAIRLGDLVIPWLTKFVEKITNVVRAISDMSPEMQKTILKFLAFAAAIGPILLIGGKITKTLSPVIGVLSQVGNGFKTFSNVAGTALNSFSDGVLNKFAKKIELSMILSGNKLAKLAPMVGKAVSLANIGMQALFPAAVIGIALAGLGLLYSKFGTQIDKLLEVAKTKGPEIITNLGNGIANKIPDFVNQGATLINHFAQALAANLPAILTAGTNIVIALVQSVGNNAGKLIQSALLVVGSFLQGVMQNLPRLIVAGVTLIGQLLVGIVQNIPMLIATAGRIIAGFIDGLGQSLPQLLGSGIKIIFELIKGIVQAIPQIVLAGVEIVMTLGKSILGALGNIAGSLVTGVKGFFKNIFSPGKEEAKNTKTDVETEMNGLSSTLDDITSSLGPKFQQNANQAKIGFTSEMSMMSQETQTKLQEMSNATGMSMDEIVRTVQEKGELTKGNLTIKASEMNTNVSGQTDEMANNMIDSISRGVDGANTQFDGLSAKLPTDASATNQATAGQYEDLANRITSSTEQANTAVTSGIDTINSNFEMRLGTLPAKTDTILNNVSNSFTNAFNALGKGVDSNLQKIISAYSSTMAKMNSISNSGLNNLSSRFTSSFNRISATVTAGTNRIVVSITNMNNRVNASFSQFASRFIATNSNMWNRFNSQSTSALNRNYSAFSSNISKLQSKFTSYANKVKSLNNSMWTAVVNKTRQAGNSMTSGFSSACNRMTSLASSMRSRLIAIMNSSVGGMRSAGYNAGMGFYSGLASTRGSIMGLASSIAASVSARIRSALRIHSPSRVLMNLGSYAGEGLAVGLEKSKRYVNNAVDGLSNTIKGVDTGLNSSYSDFNSNSKAMPLVINLRLGNKEFRAISRDITQEQGKDLRLEANFGI